MNLKKIALATAAGTALLAAVPASATPPHWAPAHGWHAKHHPSHHHYRAPAYVVVPRPVIVAPRPYYYAPVVYAPRPVVVRATPVIYGNIPVSPNVNIGFGVRF